jgi:hypothetical protein
MLSCTRRMRGSRRSGISASRHRSRRAPESRPRASENPRDPESRGFSPFLSEAHCDPLAATQRGDALFAPQTLDHDADLLFGCEPPACFPSDLPDRLLSGVLLRHGSFSFRSQKPSLSSTSRRLGRHPPRSARRTEIRAAALANHERARSRRLLEGLDALLSNSLRRTDSGLTSHRIPERGEYASSEA